MTNFRTVVGPEGGEVGQVSSGHLCCKNFSGERSGY